MDHFGDPQHRPTKEKRNLGEQWAEKSGGKALFLMAVEYDDRGRDVYQ